mgnify:FL=1
MDRKLIDSQDQDAFDQLQKKLVPLWSSLDHLNKDEQTIVVVPSADLDVALTASHLQAYEERFLFMLFLLRQPRARLIFVTGQEISDEIVDYFLDLLPGVIRSNASKRLHFVTPMEATWSSLTRKLLARPHLIEEIRALIPDQDRAHLVPFMTSWDDRELAMRLGIPMYGADPAHMIYGTKSSGRQIFAEAGIAHPPGIEELHSRAEVVAAVMKLVKDHPETDRVIVKLNEGVSGFGNATLDLRSLGEVTPDSVDQALGQLAIDSALGDLSVFLAHLEQEGGVVEAMLSGEIVRSPSVQLRITPLGEVELLSTHDQILGGESGQVFVGSRFPADGSYSRQISKSATRVGEVLAERGVIGRFALDYVVVQKPDGSWDEYAIEINLRKGGTTHPFLTLQFLTDGQYDSETAVFIAPDGTEKHYVASDHVDIEGLEVFRPQDLLDLALLHDYHFDQVTQTGVVFHMLSAMPTHGFVGVTCIENSHAGAEALYERVIGFLTDQALAHQPDW